METNRPHYETRVCLALGRNEKDMQPYLQSKEKNPAGWQHPMIGVRIMTSDSYIGIKEQKWEKETSPLSE